MANKNENKIKDILFKASKVRTWRDYKEGKEILERAGSVTKKFIQIIEKHGIIGYEYVNNRITLPKGRPAPIFDKRDYLRIMIPDRVLALEGQTLAPGQFTLDSHGLISVRPVYVLKARWGRNKCLQGADGKMYHTYELTIKPCKTDTTKRGTKPFIIPEYPMDLRHEEDIKSIIELHWRALYYCRAKKKISKDEINLLRSGDHGPITYR